MNSWRKSFSLWNKYCTVCRLFWLKLQWDFNYIVLRWVPKLLSLLIVLYVVIGCFCATVDSVEWEVWNISHLAFYKRFADLCSRMRCAAFFNLVKKKGKNFFCSGRGRMESPFRSWEVFPVVLLFLCWVKYLQVNQEEQRLKLKGSYLGTFLSIWVTDLHSFFKYVVEYGHLGFFVKKKSQVNLTQWAVHNRRDTVWCRQCNGYICFRAKYFESVKWYVPNYWRISYIAKVKVKHMVILG